MSILIMQVRSVVFSLLLAGHFAKPFAETDTPISSLDTEIIFTELEVIGECFR
jgi:hypothetical protein